MKVRRRTSCPKKHERELFHHLTSLKKARVGIVEAINEQKLGRITPKRERRKGEDSPKTAMVQSSDNFESASKFSPAASTFGNSKKGLPIPHLRGAEGHYYDLLWIAY